MSEIKAEVAIAEHAANPVVYVKSIQRVFVHHRQKEDPAGPKHAMHFPHRYPAVGATEVPNDFDANHEIEKVVRERKFGGNTIQNSIARILLDRDFTHGFCRFEAPTYEAKFLKTSDIFA